MEEKLGNLIKKAREEKGISQRELAKILNIDYSYIAKIETNVTKKPAVEIIFKLAKVLNLNFIDLLLTCGYTKIEILNLTNIGAHLSFDLGILSIIDKKDLEKYAIENEEGIFLDIGKILDEYKSDNIDYEKTVKLLNCVKPLQLDDKTCYFSSKGNIIIDLENFDDNIDIEEIL